MENLQNYLKEKILEFNKKYNVEQSLQYRSTVDKEIKRRWENDYKYIRNQWQYIGSISDVMSRVDNFTGRVNYFKDKRGFYEDAYDMDLELYKAILAIRKMAQCYDIEDKFDFYMFGKDDIDNLFSTLYNGLKDMENINMRRSMQD